LTSDAVHVAIVLSPFILLPVAGWLGARGTSRAHFLGLIPAALTGYFAWAFWLVSANGPFTVTVPWAPNLGLSLSFHFDGLGVLFAILIAAVGTLIVLYAADYLRGHPDAGKFQISLFAFMGSMLGLVLADNLIALFVFWELTGFTSYLLIGFEHDRLEARRAALQALLVTGAGGLALLAAGILLWQAAGTTSLSEMFAGGLNFAGHPTYVGITALIMLAAFTKSAQFPFHFWLPNAMQAPTPVSAYLHSATMVKAGVYLVARMTPLVGGTALWTYALTVVGALTMIGGSYRAVLESDLKRILAYSTISALGFLMLLLGIGTPQAVVAAVVYLLAHACYKGALFLVAGAIERETGVRDVMALTGLRRAMPRTTLAAMLAAASMAGIPLFFGFIAKEQIYESVGTSTFAGLWPEIVVTAAVVASIFQGTAALITGVSPFVGRPMPAEGTHEVPVLLWSGALVLGGAGFVLGLAPAIVDVPVGLAAASIVQDTVPVSLEIWHGVSATLLLSAATLVGSISLFIYRDRMRRVAWPRSLGTERLYTLSLASLQAISRWTAPALQSASLRSYVLIVVLTGVAFVATGLATGGVLPTLSRWTAIEPYEGMVAVLIVAAALLAAFARSNIIAALSLGAVGYGVALIYALFGAPDLAMTQFAVETLTVVIFVLVFYQLRGFGDLSSRLVKTRDALVAAVAGTVIATLVLFIGASGTTSRLSPFFVDAAPTLAHGRNVVNVILVDFRGFDTLGEITVLVTVAIGVRALLLIRRERRP
jgi:multicomponent Na+:H+ antiporter subunit A